MDRWRPISQAINVLGRSLSKGVYMGTLKYTVVTCRMMRFRLEAVITVPPKGSGSQQRMDPGGHEFADSARLLEECHLLNENGI